MKILVAPNKSLKQLAITISRHTCRVGCTVCKSKCSVCPNVTIY